MRDILTHLLTQHAKPERANLGSNLVKWMIDRNRLKPVNPKTVQFVMKSRRIVIRYEVPTFKKESS
jgi:hypothetical protein